MEIIPFLIRSLAVIVFASLSTYLPEKLLSGVSKEETALIVQILPFTQNLASAFYLFFFESFIQKNKHMQLSKRDHLLNILCGLLFWLQSYLSYASIPYISFPLKITISAAKVLLAMPSSIISRGFRSPKGTIFGYTGEEIGVSFCIFLGLVTMFIPSSSGKGLLENFSWLGAALLILSINISCVFDEFQSVMIKHGYNVNVVLMWNMLATSLIYGILFFTSGSLPATIELVTTKPYIVGLILMISACHVATQVSIVTLKSHHGIWWKNIVTSLRKCISLVLSVVLFGHEVTKQQIIGVIIVFGCLFWAASIEMKRKEKAKKVDKKDVDKKDKASKDKKSQQKQQKHKQH